MQAVVPLWYSIKELVYFFPQVKQEVSYYTVQANLVLLKIGMLKTCLCSLRLCCAKNSNSKFDGNEFEKVNYNSILLWYTTQTCTL